MQPRTGSATVARAHEPGLNDCHQHQPKEAHRCGNSTSWNGPHDRCEQEEVVGQRCKVDGCRRPGRPTLAGHYQRHEREQQIHNRAYAQHVSPQQGAHRHLPAPAAGKERQPVALVHRSDIPVVTAAEARSSMDELIRQGQLPANPECSFGRQAAANSQTGFGSPGPGQGTAKHRHTKVAC